MPTSRRLALTLLVCLPVSVLQAAPAAVQDFGQTSVGSSTSVTMTIPVSASSPLTCALHYAVDFSAGACSPVAGGVSLTVQFAPVYPGLRQDAIVVKDSSGTIVAEAFLHGLGQGPLVNFDPGIINTLLFSSDSGGATYSPWGVVADSATGIAYLADRTSKVVFRIDPRTKNKSLYAGVISSTFVAYNSGDGGPATSAYITPDALALDAAGNLYIDSANVVRKVDSETGIITTVAGGGTNPQGDGGPATAVSFNTVCGLAVDTVGNLYVCEEYAQRIRKVDAATGIIQTFAGSPQAQLGDGGPATDAYLSQPMGITLDYAGNLYIADYGTSCVRRVDGQTNIITTVAGIPFQRNETGNIANGQPATSVALYNPGALATDAAGDLYIADADLIRRVSAATGLLDTITGMTSPLVSLSPVTPLDGYPASVAAFAGGYLSIDGAGNLFTTSVEIQRSNGVLIYGPTAVGQTSSPQTTTVANGGNQPLAISSFTLGPNFSRPSAGSNDCLSSISLSPGFNCDVALAFEPSTTATVTDTLTLSDNNLNVANALQTVTLKGPWAQISLSTTASAFGSGYVGRETGPNSITIYNSGDSPVSVSVAIRGAAAGDFSLQSNSCGTIIAQNLCGFWVFFTAQAAGPRTAQLVITNNSDGSSQTIALTGTGVIPPPAQMSLSNTSLNFAAPWYTYGGAQFIVVQSTSDVTPLVIQSIALQDSPASGFYLSTDCPLGAGHSISTCFITVSFTPTAGTTHYSDTLLLTDNAAGSPQSIPVVGSTVSEALQFIPVTPCRIVDTRTLGTGQPIGGGSYENFSIVGTSCGIPSNVAAYSLNVTAVPIGGLGYLTIWPLGIPQPAVSTLNSDGRVKANAAIVGAAGSYGVSVFVSNPSHVVLDINGYFVPAGASSAGLQYFPLTPCRITDTRLADGPLGGPFLAGGVARSFPLLSSPCALPSNAQAYSLNITAVPRAGLGYLTVWPSGQTQPLVSTLNAPTGQITANAAIVPAGTNGAISLFASNDSDVLIDVDGYFAPPQSGGLSLYSVLPCRVIDTRDPAGSPPFVGILPVPVAGACDIPTAAEGLVANATVVPSSGLAYLSLWPNGQTQPLVSTLNAQDGVTTSNLAIVASTNGLIDAFASNPTYLILDVSGYFAP